MIEHTPVAVIKCNRRLAFHIAKAQKLIEWNNVEMAREPIELSRQQVRADIMYAAHKIPGHLFKHTMVEDNQAESRRDDLVEDRPNHFI